MGATHHTREGTVSLSRTSDLCDPVALGRAAALLAALVLSACSGQAVPGPTGGGAANVDEHGGDHGPQPQSVRPRPEIPTDWPAGKRIVMHVTPSLDQSYVVACDLPVPALTYIEHGHSVTIAVDRSAITAFRRDAEGRTQLDRLALLDSDLDRLADALRVPTNSVPKNFGDLYRVLRTRGVRIVTSDAALRAAGVTRGQLDPVIQVLPVAEFNRILSDLDALLPYDDIGPVHSIFEHTTGQESGHGGEGH